MIKKVMYLVIILLGASSVYAQTCTLTPSCEDLGYTMNSEQCGGNPSLKCPFDETKLFCYQEQDNDGEGGAIILTIKNDSDSTYNTNIFVRGGYINVDCGNGTTGVGVNSSDNIEVFGGESPEVSCAYGYGEHTLKITGVARGIILKKEGSLYVKEISSLNIKKVSYLEGVCGIYTTGTIQLPPDLINADYLFSGCRRLTGTIPPLPKFLVSGNDMFSGCTGLTGTIPELPSYLQYGSSMFSGCTGLIGTIPELPSYLQYGSSMFYGCTSLTGTIPELPSYLTSAGSMFRNCSGLTGNAPKKPRGLTRDVDVKDMFSGTNVTLTSEWPEAAKK